MRQRGGKKKQEISYHACLLHSITVLSGEGTVLFQWTKFQL